MREIDLDPREHSHSYELKPMSRWWLVLSLLLTLIMALASGVFDAMTWGMFFGGFMVTASAILCFPRLFLAKDR